MALDVLEQIPKLTTSNHDHHLHTPSSPQQGHDQLLPPPSSPVDQVDTFLKEAVNSRNRITVLRLEQEIEKFARNPNQNDLLLKPMTSSYERLAAHRVGQYYGLQSMVLSAASPKVSRILLVKTPETRLPCIRLADIPVDNASKDKVSFGPGERFAIKQRVNALNADGTSNCLSGLGKTPLKSMQEREEEYDKARARIFNNRDKASPANEENEVSDAASAEKLEDKPDESTRPTYIVVNGDERLNSSRVAIFRDREKDMKDPDYDRSGYKRYSIQFDPGMHTGFHFPQRYSNINFHDDYMRNDGSWRPQLHLDQPPYPRPLQIRGPWMGSGYQDPVFNHFNPGFVDPYMPRPRFTAHPTQYGFVNDGFPYPLQPGLCPAPSLSAVGR